MTLTIVLLIVTGFLLGFSFYESVQRFRFDALKRRMIRAIVDKYPGSGRIIAPEERYPGAYNCEIEEPEYVFIAEDELGVARRMIFVTKDCAHVHALPWVSYDRIEVVRQ